MWNYQGNQSSNWNLLNWQGYTVYNSSNPQTEIDFVGGGAPPSEFDSWSVNDGFYDINKWYANPITNNYDVESNITLRRLFDEFINFSAVTHVLSPPDDSGIYINVIFYFY